MSDERETTPIGTDADGNPGGWRRDESTGCRYFDPHRAAELTRGHMLVVLRWRMKQRKDLARPDKVLDSKIKFLANGLREYEQNHGLKPVEFRRLNDGQDK